IARTGSTCRSGRPRSRWRAWHWRWSAPRAGCGRWFEVRRLLWLCFFLSGASGLALELLWMRSAALAVGSTATTASAVLAAYFAGLALGSLYARRTPARPVRRYAQLELCAAAAALWSCAVF